MILEGCASAFQSVSENRWYINFLIDDPGPLETWQNAHKNMAKTHRFLPSQIPSQTGQLLPIILGQLGHQHQQQQQQEAFPPKRASIPATWAASGKPIGWTADSNFFHPMKTPHEPRKKTRPYFPLNPGCLIGILICHGAYYNPYITG